jgi:hypothetical protein
VTQESTALKRNHQARTRARKRDGTSCKAFDIYIFQMYNRVSKTLLPESQAIILGCKVARCDRHPSCAQLRSATARDHRDRPISLTNEYGDKLHPLDTPWIQREAR